MKTGALAGVISCQLISLPICLIVSSFIVFSSSGDMINCNENNGFSHDAKIDKYCC